MHLGARKAQVKTDREAQKGPGTQVAEYNQFRHPLRRYAAADLIEAVQSLIRPEGVRGKFELAETPYFGNFVNHSPLSLRLAI